MEFITISKLIEELEKNKNSIGDVPVLLSNNGENILSPLQSLFPVKIKKQKTEDTETAIVLANFILDKD